MKDIDLEGICFAAVILSIIVFGFGAMFLKFSGCM